MNPILARTLIFLGIVIAFMLIIIGVASISHAAECEPPPKLFFIWDMGEPCSAVHHKRHHRKGVMHSAGRTNRPSISPSDARPRSASTPAGAVKWANPEHEKLFEEFENWRIFGRR
jgi:hypothetical protein